MLPIFRMISLNDFSWKLVNLMRCQSAMAFSCFANRTPPAAPHTDRSSTPHNVENTRRFRGQESSFCSFPQPSFSAPPLSIFCAILHSWGICGNWLVFEHPPTQHLFIAHAISHFNNIFNNLIKLNLTVNDNFPLADDASNCGMISQRGMPFTIWLTRRSVG